MQNYNVISVRASPITMSRRNWGMSPYKSQMNLVLLPNKWFIGENNGFMGEFFVIHGSQLLVYLVKKH